MMTLSQITIELGASRPALERALARLSIQPAGRAGTTRLFNAAAVAALRAEIARLDARRQGAKA